MQTQEANPQDTEGLALQQRRLVPPRPQGTLTSLNSELGMDLEAQESEDHSKSSNESLRLIGLEIGSFSRTHQYVICTSILFFFTLLYGYLQELVSIHVFKRQYSLFVTLLQFGGYTFFAFLQWVGRDGKRSTVPIVYGVTLAVLQASMQGLSNLSMRYLNYPAKVLFKSSRVIPTMVFGVAIYGKRYSLREVFTIGVLVLGLVIFMLADAATSPEFDPVGVLLIVTSLVVDACIINLQEHLFTVYSSNEEEMIFMSYAGGSLLLLLICMGTGEASQGLAFLHQQTDPVKIIVVIFVFAACGFCGVSSVAALTKRFGALAAAITTTARKALTLVLSFVFFPKPFLPGHFFGIILFVGGLVLKSKVQSKHHQGSTPPSQISDSSTSSLGKLNAHKHGKERGRGNRLQVKGLGKDPEATKLLSGFADSDRGGHQEEMMEEEE